MDDLEMLSEKMTVAGSIVYLTDDADSPDGMKKAGDEKEPMLKEEDRRKSDPGILPSPMACASFLSKYITMWWLNSLLKKGSKQPLEAKDLYAILEGEQTETVTDALEREWEKEMYKANQQGKYPSFLSALRRTFGVGYSLLGLVALMREILKIAGPIFLGQLIRYFVEDSPISTGDAYLYATGLILCSLMSSMFNAPFTFMSQVYGMRIRVACTGLVYRKSLKLSTAALHGTTTGNIVNLISSDTQKFDWTAPNLHYLMIGPVIAVIVLVVLWLQIGPSALAGMGLILLLAAMQLKMGNTLFSFRTKAIHWMDERVKVMNEIIAGMRVIKMYTWEDSFSNWIRQIRKSELKWFLKLSFIQGAFQSFFFSSSVVISFVTFMTYVLTGEVLKAQTVFTCISLFNIMRVVMALQFPIAITLLNECRVSIKRMEDILLMDEMQSEGLVTSKLRPKLENCHVAAKNIKALWNKNLQSPTLENVSFKVSSGELLGVIGAVGSGKSSLLMVILGELPLTEGSITVKGKIGYSSQQAWVYNGSLRQNILFGQNYDEDKFKEVTKACALDKDIELLPDGDMTFVGERGVSLSGGQRARVNLARAVYADADIYLMDDPLSAVDADVGRHLFEKCICGYLAKKPRILVTHQLQHIGEADDIIVLDKGKVVNKGPYKELSLCKGSANIMECLMNPETEAGREVEAKDAERLMVARQLSRQESFPCHRLSKIADSNFSIVSAATTFSAYDDNLLPGEEKQEGAVISMLADWWLSYWSNTEESYFVAIMLQTGNSTASAASEPDRGLLLGVYGGFVIGLFLLCLFSTELFYTLTVVASRNLYEKMLSSLLRAPMYFFDNNSIGRILNRFAKDIGMVDDLMPMILCDVLQTGLMCLGILGLVAVSNPATFVIIVPVTIGFVYLRNYFMKSSREIKRIEGISRSPLFGHFSTTLLGLDTIRAYEVEETFTEQVNGYQDAHSRAWFCYLAGQTWLNFRLEMLTVLFLAFVAFVSAALKGTVDLSAGVVGLTLTYSIMLTSVFQPFIEGSAELENLMTSVERIVEYINLEAEAPAETVTKPKDDWPSRGQIDFDDMSFRYHRSLPDVLHHITCTIKPSEKIGVVGRTGAGKSSLISTLFRLSEPRGKIEIDGVNIQELGLKDLRSKLSIIPQEPVLFSGPMRRNLDPFGEHLDTELWNVLEEVQLKNAVEELPNKLDEELGESGSNFSVGQRQLVCLARAILRHSRILVIDEATANVDQKTDSLIQTTIREKFKHCTVLTIAHRLNTIIDSDKVLVLDAGRLKEFDAPYVLLKNPRGIFCQLVEQTGPVEARRLYEIARDKYNQQQVAILETDVINDNESQEEKKPEVSVSLPPADDSQSMPLPQSHDESQKPKLLPAGEVEQEPDFKHSQLSSLVHVKI
ncbi:multidrug resistance-associated protein 4-like isoform X2 [Pocillopora damicornis]|uniref:multidrug resistance-associated protein 4-like isoform X2 n=1 Tax=Pocillopora damicornis TaxID=46731 RepID=UPI000F551151|nr:multidrug resistance-associated protein 4-like isoform X2 [Pocillopora damicornis]